MNRSYSLRIRLTLIILIPLLFVAGAAGLWQLDNARVTAGDVFDRSLQSAALAVANDVALSGGDALAPATRKILDDTSGGPVLYHVYAPDGVIVAGYATPPVGIPRSSENENEPIYFNADYRGREVRGFRMRTGMQVDGFGGIFTTTVWQDVTIRAAFVRDLMLRSVVTIASIITSLTLIVWFGVRIGLYPLADLQQAIDLRSGEDLKPIRRPVPIEVEGIVRTLNRLLAQVRQAMDMQSEFISNAAHQLRNPVAGVLSLAESVKSAKNETAMRQRADDLVRAAKETSELAQKLLTYERARSINPATAKETFSLGKMLSELVSERAAMNLKSVSLDYMASPQAIEITGDRTMIREAVSNLVDNALRHGGAGLSSITVALEATGETASVIVSDNGKGLTDADIQTALQRFGQVPGTSGGSGLGLPIVVRVAEQHGGSLRLDGRRPGLEARFTLPR